jgi:hypothetical protein
MNTAPFRKTVVAAAVAGTLSAAMVPTANAEVVELSWIGAFTFLSPAGEPYLNFPSDYLTGYYANGDGDNLSFGTPQYPGNVNYAGSGFGGPYATTGWPNGAVGTAHGWQGNRTPISGTIKFDLSSGAGVATINPFFFIGDVPGSGAGTHVADMQNFTLLAVDTVGTLVGSMLMSWNGAGHSVSIVMDGSGLLQNLTNLVTGGPTNTLSGVGALPATENMAFGALKTSTGFTLPLGPSPIATRTTNAIGCEALALATMVNAYTIIRNETNLAMCDLSQDDGIGGSPVVSNAINHYNINVDMTSIHFDSYSPNPTVPLPPAVWLFGSGLLGLMGIARRKRILKGAWQQAAGMNRP